MGTSHIRKINPVRKQKRKRKRSDSVTMGYYREGKRKTHICTLANRLMNCNKYTYIHENDTYIKVHT
jgi:hypothetical protein